MVDEYKYVLFTHLANEKAWAAFDEYVGKVCKILSDDNAKGMLIVFYDAGWISLLNTIGSDFSPEKMSEEFEMIYEKDAHVKRLKSNDSDISKRVRERWISYLNEIEFDFAPEKIPRKFREIYENEVHIDIKELKNNDSDISRRVRLVTAKDIYKIINNLRGNKPGPEATELKRFLVGDEPGVRYDTTKVVEAILRIRQIGSGIPVIRMDWDALFNKETLKLGHLMKLVRDIPQKSSEYEKNHDIYSFMISGSYLKEDDPDVWDINAFNTAYATRMFPALIPVKSAVELLDEWSIKEGLADKSEDVGLDNEKLMDLSEKGMFNKSVMESYYEGMSEVGSHRDDSVISGAGLILSDGAILDLPPFSNFQQNVMWIDDHLKYELHHALGHFPPKDRVGYKCQFTCPVYKDRLLSGQKNLRQYTLEVYIPTMFWGMIMDGWIASKKGNKKTAFVKTIEKALMRGVFDLSDKEGLIKELKKDAVIRINEIINLWSVLRDEDNLSFAALWVEGDREKIRRVMSILSSHYDKDNDWLGWGLVNSVEHSIDQEVSEICELRKPIQQSINSLINDLCIYIEWTLKWPKFIQSVRAVRHGELNFD